MPSKRFLAPRARLLPVALVAACLSTAGAARAEDLVELYNAAHAYDAGYLAARAQADSVEYRAAQSKAAFLPSLSATANLTRNEVEYPPQSFVTAGAGGVPGVETTPDARLGYTDQSAQLQGRQALFDRNASATERQAYKGLEEAHLALETAEQDLIVRVAQAYFDVLGAQDALNTARGNKAAITEQLASAKRNFEVGTATITDTREAQARFDLATSQEIAADNDLRTKRVTLDQLVGRKNVNPNPLVSPTTLPGVTPDDPDQWVNIAENAQPTVRKAALDLDIAELETDKARAGHLPTLAVVGNISADHQSGAGAEYMGTVKTAALGLQLSVPLFSGYSVQNRIKETLDLAEKSRQDLESARRGADQQTRTAYLAVVSGEAQVKALEAAESSSKLALDATQLGYKVGVRVNLDVLNAENQLYSTERDLSKARYDLLVGELRLRQAAGVLKADDLAAINRLLMK